MSEPAPMGAHVEIVEPLVISPLDTEEQAVSRLDRLPVIKPRRVRINGTDVGLIKKDSLSIQTLTDEATEVTLTLLVKRVEIKAE